MTKRSGYCLTSFAATGLLTLIFLNFTGCRKISNDNRLSDEQKIVRFFSHPGSLKPAVISVMEKLRGINSRKPFALKMIHRAGYPIWSKTVVTRNANSHPRESMRTSEDDTTYTYTPFASEEFMNIQAVLITRTVGDEVMYKFLLADDYRDYPSFSERGDATATDVAQLFFYFENMVNGHESMRIKDRSRIFSIEPEEGLYFYANNVSISSRYCSSTDIFWITICVEIEAWDQEAYDTDILPLDEYEHTRCRTFTFIVTSTYECGGGGGSGDYPGGGMAGGSTPGGLTVAQNDPHPFCV